MGFLISNAKLGRNMEDVMADAERDERGRFKPGHRASVGNKGGRPRNTVRELARGHTEEAVGVLVAIMRGDAAALGVRSVPIRDRREAARELLDRGWGKPTQPVAGDDSMDPIRVGLSPEDVAALRAYLADIGVLEAPGGGGA